MKRLVVVAIVTPKASRQGGREYGEGGLPRPSNTNPLSFKACILLSMGLPLRKSLTHLSDVALSSVSCAIDERKRFDTGGLRCF